MQRQSCINRIACPAQQYTVVSAVQRQETKTLLREAMQLENWLLPSASSCVEPLLARFMSVDILAAIKT